MKKYLSLLFLFIVIFGQHVSAFEGYSTIGARSAALGRASVTLSDFWSIHNNPSGIALQLKPAAGIAYENRYQMKELSLKSAAFVLPVNFGVLGLSFNQFGYKAYNENKIGLAYARSFGPMLRLGLQLDYLSSRFSEGYEGSNHVTFEFGVQSDLTDKLTAAALIFNPIGVKRSDLTNERIPVVMRIGLGYRFTEELSAIAEIEKQTDFGPDGRFGIEYKINEKFYARTGVAVNPGLFTFGAGWHTGRLHIDIAAAMHQVVGTTAQVSLVYHFGKSIKE